MTEGVLVKVDRIIQVGTFRALPLWQLWLECGHAILMRSEEKPVRAVGTCCTCKPGETVVITAFVAPESTGPGGVA